MRFVRACLPLLVICLIAANAMVLAPYTLTMESIYGDEGVYARQIESYRQGLSPYFDFTVVVPLYRNAGRTLELVQRLKALPGSRLVLVEDGSGDEVARELLRGLADERVGVLLLARNVGQHRAILAGLEEVGQGSAVVMDGDLQDPPEAVPRLVEALARAPIVFAQRPGGRGVTSFLFKFLFQCASGFRLPSRVGTFVAMSPPVLAVLLSLRPRDPYLVGMLAMSGFPMAAVPVQRAGPEGTTSTYNWRGRLTLALRALRSLWSGRGQMAPVAIEERLGWIAPN